MDQTRIEITDSDLQRLLAEADREDRLLTDPRERHDPPRESLDEQILAGLVSP